MQRTGSNIVGNFLGRDERGKGIIGGTLLGKLEGLV